MTLTISNDALLDYPIEFCWDGKFSFFMCQDNSLQPYLEAPLQRWISIVPGLYQLELATQSEAIIYNLTLTSTNADDYTASDGALAIQLTAISPATTVITTAGSTVQYLIEMRTTANIRKTLVFTNISANIRVQLTQNQQASNITIVPGGKLGQYMVYITTNVSALPSNPNSVQFYIQNQLVQSTTPLLIINPAPISTVSLLTPLTDSTVDSTY
jgi:hypothetical protein